MIGSGQAATGFEARSHPSVASGSSLQHVSQFSKILCETARHRVASKFLLALLNFPTQILLLARPQKREKDKILRWNYFSNCFLLGNHKKMLEQVLAKTGNDSSPSNFCTKTVRGSKRNLFQPQILLPSRTLFD